MEEYGTFAQYSFNPREDESEKGAMTLSITTLSKIEKKTSKLGRIQKFYFLCCVPLRRMSEHYEKSTEQNN